MEVLKGENAIEKYGDKGKDGVIIIIKKESNNPTSQPTKGKDGVIIIIKE